MTADQWASMMNGIVLIGLIVGALCILVSLAEWWNQRPRKADRRSKKGQAE